MATEKRILRTEDDRREWCSDLYKYAMPLRVAALEGEDRSLEQNALFHKWCTEIGHQMGENMSEVKNRAKLEFGCPILCGSDPVFNGFFHKAVKPLNYEQQVKSMRFVAVTSAMTVPQMSEFMKQFEQHYRGEGYTLTNPEDRA